MTAGRTLKETIVVAAAVPARVTAWVFGGLGATTYPSKLRNVTMSIPVVAYVMTAFVWAIEIYSGILYPVFDDGNLRNSWGGPTLAGAWITHVAVGIGALLVISFPFALWRAKRMNPLMP